MPLPSSGPISLSQVAVELGRSSTATTSMGETAVRTLFQVPSGQISMSDGYGKSNTFAFTISSSTTNANLRTLAVNAGWPGSNNVSATIASGVVMTADGTGVSALTIDGAFPQGVTLINNGVIVGRGGDGGAGGTSSPGAPTQGAVGLAGGPALLVQVPVSINNAGTIAGGGGGGSGGNGRGSGSFPTAPRSAGGGGGGGRSSFTNSNGGAGGPGPVQAQPGTAGTYSGAGIGGENARQGPNPGTGGPGGDWGAAGNPAPSAFGSNTPGAAGSAVSGNPQISWIAFGTRLGPIS